LNHSSELTSGRIAAAFAVAVVADFIQLPLNILFFTGWLAIPAEMAVFAVDGAAFAVLSATLGFHWALLPTFFVELVPVADALPTWTMSVAFVVWQRKQAEAGPSARVDSSPSASVVTIRGEPVEIASGRSRLSCLEAPRDAESPVPPRVCTPPAGGIGHRAGESSGRGRSHDEDEQEDRNA
jgi:hypothetical protein